MKEQIFNILNIRMSESKYVFELLKVQFFIGLSNALINIVSFTLFIHLFSISGLPYAFLGMAFFLLLLNMGYEKLEHKYSPTQLLRVILFTSIITFILFWLGLLVSENFLLIYCLLVSSTLFYMITSYAFWGIVSLLFNIRESKRVFSIVGSGDIPAKFFGYLATPLLIPIVGVPNLLLLAVVSMVTGFYLLNKLVRKPSWQSILRQAHARTHKKDHTPKKGRIEAFFRSELIFSISLLSVLCYNVFILIDYTFISQVKSRYYDLDNLAAFIAQFFAFGRIIALVVKLTFSSRAIERLGIIACLSITPVLLFLFACSFFFTSDAGYSVFIFGIMALLTEVLRSTIQEPVFLILFQPLSERLRLKGHIIAKGYMFPISLVIVGLSLIVFPMVGIPLTIMTTVKILLINLCIWAVVIVLIKNAYIKVLHYSVQKGVYSGEELQVADQKTIEILLKKVEVGKDAEVIYALKLLEGASYEGWKDLMVKQLFTTKADVKKFVMLKLEDQNDIDIDILHSLLEKEKDKEIKERIISMLCKLDPTFLLSVSDNLAKQDFSTRKIIIFHLLSQREFSYLFTAAKEINALISSPVYEEKELALQIISELSDIKFTDAIELLLHDNEPVIKRSAIIAACKLNVKKLLPYILQLLKEPTHKYLALKGLQLYGDQLFEDILSFPQKEWRNCEQDLIKIAGKCKGTNSANFLMSQLSNQSAQDDKVIHALWLKGFEAETVEHIHQFKQLLMRYVNTAFEKIFYCKEVPSLIGYRLIQQSLISEVHNDVLTSLKICSILYHKKEIGRVIELVEYNKNTKLFNAMEMLEWTLPKKISMQINSLIDFVLDPAFNKHSLVEYDWKGFMNSVLVTNANAFNVWTKAVCIYCFFKNEQVGLIRELGQHEEMKAHLIINETRDFALQAI